VAGAEERALQRLRAESAVASEALTEKAASIPFDWRWRVAGAAVAATVVFILAMQVSAIRDALTRIDAPAIVETADGGLYRISGLPIQAGERVEAGDILRTNGGAGAQLLLADGSRVEMRSQSELSLERADDGIGIRLRTGGIIVNAAKQSRGQLYVQTKHMTVSVVGTVFLVNAEEDGSRVAVIEGEVRVREGTTETKLRPGEHVSTNPRLEPLPVKEEIAWSRQADAHVALLRQSVPQNPSQTADRSAPATGTADRSAAASAGSAQATAPKPKFEEASIRPCTQEPAAPPGGRGGGPNSLLMTPGRFYVQCMTVATLIRTAYGYGPMELEFMNTSENASRPRTRPGMRLDATYGLGVEDGRRVRGGPDWVRSDKYTIEAVGDGAADAETMRGPMLQELLERRVQVRVHIEAEQVPAFALTVASGGLKIKPMQEGDCTREPPSDAVKAERDRHGWTGPVLITEAARFGIKPTCGTIYGEQNGPNFRMEHVAQSPGSVAGTVGRALDARVVDRTGITDRFIFGWEFGPDESTPGILRMMFQERTWVPRPGWDGPSTLPKAPPIFTALEQQLGLKVEPIRVPREFIVIDRVERPSPN